MSVSLPHNATRSMRVFIEPGRTLRFSYVRAMLVLTRTLLVDGLSPPH
jgi:hypothetical protein